MDNDSGQSATVQQLFAQAVRHHADGDLPRAEVHYNKVLAIDPRHAQSVHGERVAWCGHDSGNHIIFLELRDSGELRTIIDAAIRGGS